MAARAERKGDIVIDNPYYGPEGHGPYELVDIGDLDLEEGGTLRRCKLAVATFGKLDAQKINAILVPTWYSGTSKIIEQVFVGEGRALDPARYFIIVCNQIGSGLSTSPHNSDDPAQRDSRKVRIGDDVRAQHRLVTKIFGLSSLALVVGGSMGAQQTYEWAVRYPDMVRRAAPIAGTARNTEHDFIFAETLNEAMTSDPGLQRRRYTASSDVADGLRRQAKLWTVMGWSTDFFREGRHRALGFADMKTFVDEFMCPLLRADGPERSAVDGLEVAARRRQPDDGRRPARGAGPDQGEDLRHAGDHDMFFPPSDCQAEWRLIPDAEFRPIQSIDGHLALFGADPAAIAQIDQHLMDLLAVPR